MRPKDESVCSLSVVPLNAVRLGGAKFARLKRLKASTRNCKRALSLICGNRKVLIADKSKVRKFGPMKVPRPNEPNVPAG